jgi:ketosteroid isomerase-like protein
MNFRPQILTLIIVVVFSFTLLPVADAKNVKDDKSEVIRTIEVLAEAGINRDIATIDRLYSEDYFHTNADGSVMTKQQVIAFYKTASGGTIESSKHDEYRVQIHDKMAVASTRVTIKGKSQQGEPFTRTYRVTYALYKLRGVWQVTASHASMIL